MKIGFTLNGAPVCVEAPGTVSLLTLLRDYCRLTGTKRGCEDVYKRQVGGGVSMGVGYALTENADTPGGVTRAADLDSYLLPTALDMCPVRTVLLEEGAGVPPLLVHGIGEPATSIVAPAITNAMSAALGARIDTLPADLETVRAILDEKKR